MRKKPVKLDNDNVEDLKAVDTELLERPDEEAQGVAERSGAVRLEPVYESPWSWPFTSPKIMVDEAPPGWPFGLCRLCNNRDHAYIDACVMTGKIGALHVAGFKDHEIARHLVHHVGPIYREMFSELLGDLDESDLPAEAVMVYKKMASVEKKMKDDEESCPVYTEGRDEGKPGRINATYAWNGPQKLLSPHPWSIERTKQEMDDRKRDAINFYDAMVDIDDKAKVIYKEGMAIGGSKGLAVAVKALHERRGAMTDLAKVGLIAKSVSDRAKSNELSPGLQSMLDSLFSGEPERLEAVKNVTPPSLAALPEPPPEESDPVPSLAAREAEESDDEDDDVMLGDDDFDEDDGDE